MSSSHLCPWCGKRFPREYWNPVVMRMVMNGLADWNYNQHVAACRERWDAKQRRYIDDSNGSFS
jgi:hypothetical protein